MKYWVCKRAAPHAAEALECLGGNGYVEDSGMPLLYRDAPLNSIWEGSGNVAALDVLRAMVKEPEGLPAFLEECSLAAGADRRLDAHLERVRGLAVEVFESGEPQFSARRIVEDLAVALQASLLVRDAPPAVADAFCAARLAGGGGRVYGTLPAGVDAARDRRPRTAGVNVVAGPAGTSTRERLLDAARELIETGGYGSASVLAIAERTGVAAATLYRHFPSKEELFLEVFRDVCGGEERAMAAAADGQVPARSPGWKRCWPRSLGARSRTPDWPGRCWPSRSTRWSTPSAWTTGGGMRR